MTAPRESQAGITDAEISMAEENIDLTLGMIKEFPAAVSLDMLVFPLLDRNNLDRVEHIQILCLTIGLLFLRLAEAEQCPWHEAEHKRVCLSEIAAEGGPE